MTMQNTNETPAIYKHIADDMRAAGRLELVHYAGAAYRDAVAARMCFEWADDPIASESTLKMRALQALGMDAR